MNTEQFKADLRKSVSEAMSKAKSDDTISMSADCLWQCTRIRSQHGPVGTNAAWVARQVFNEIIQDRQFSRFVYKP